MHIQCLTYSGYNKVVNVSTVPQIRNIIHEIQYCYTVHFKHVNITFVVCPSEIEPTSYNDFSNLSDATRVTIFETVALPSN